MNIYHFIQSKSIREYLEKSNHTFSSLEMAYIIWQCPDATLAERFDAWQEIIDTMPDETWPWEYIPMENFEHVFLSLSKCKKAIQEDIDYKTPPP